MKSLFVLLLVLSGSLSFTASGLHAQDMSIGELIAGSEQTTTLTSALEAAEMFDNLSSTEGSMILLAPTDEAFAALPEGVLSALLKPENSAALRSVLVYHLVSPAGGEEATETVSYLLEEGGATVTAENTCSNGTVYLVDKVLLPPGFDPAGLE